jgi:NAD(P)-dependent dehydrogenase (short-subunit alcohol dehydrogenase family)
MKIVISGTSTGIGHALATQLLAKGHSVWGVARSPQETPGGSEPGSFRSSQADVGDWAAMEQLAADISRTWGTVDALVACAGMQGEVGPAMECDPARWSATVRTNLDGTFFLVRALFALLKPAVGRGKVVCFSGGGATKSRVNFSAYGVAKTGVVRLVETLAEEWRGLPVDINAIAPGAINTRLTDEVLALGPAKAGHAEYEAALKQKQRGGAPLEKALGLVEYLLSAESDGISGRLLAAPWDPWGTLHTHRDALAASDIYTLRRIVPQERGQPWA